MTGRSRATAGEQARVSRRAALRGLAAFGTTLAAFGNGQAATPAAKLPALARGLNLTHWFEYERAQIVSPAEMQGLRRLGLDHVRIPFDPLVGGWRPDAGVRLSYLPELRQAIESAIAAGLDVVLDMHLAPEAKEQIENSPAAETALGTLWAHLADEFATLPAERLAFELFNEPQYYGTHAMRWPIVQRRLLEIVRERAPRHLCLLSGNEGGSFAGLSWMPPLRDPAAAWVFHYYEPYLFTHQGAAWLDTRYTTAGLRRDLRYPADLAARTPSSLVRPHPRAARELADYLAEGWGPARIRADMDKAGAYARARGVRVLCNEFGVIRANVDPASRYRWIADVRGALEANDLGWTLWDYSDIFGITRESAEPGHADGRSIEPEALRALGLAAKEGAR